MGVPGITPAYAGKSSSSASLSIGGKDHPRIRGEKLEGDWDIFEGQGSPPHTRGKAVWGRHRYEAFGITPAYAGKSGRLHDFKKGSQDHPRIRGEKLIFRHSQVMPWGSPPHTRGKEHVPEQNRGAERITPAYAGKR